jgi:hypothetical protein
MNWNWKEEGFSAPPTVMFAQPGLVLYRVWGGKSSKAGNPSRAGVCLSTQPPLSRVDAERLFSAWEWGNSCIWLTEFRVTPGTALHVGLVDQGEVFDLRLLGGRKGIQVLIENPVSSKLFEVETTRLDGDLGNLIIGAGSAKSH